MSTKEIESLNKIEEKEFDNMVKLLLRSFLIQNREQNVSIVAKKETLINDFTSFLEKYIKLEFTDSKEQKLALINFLDKMNLQRELLEIRKGEMSMTDIKTAAQRLGKKSQSAFKTK